MRRPLEAGSFLAGSIVPPKKAGLDMRPRTVIIFGNPRAGTPPMTKSATLAIDLPMKAVVWQDDQDRGSPTIPVNTTRSMCSRATVLLPPATYPKLLKPS